MVRLVRIVAGIAAVIAVTSTLGAQDTTISRRDLVDGGWRLAGMIFAAMPAGGYPITFLDDSSLISRNFRSATRWSLTDRVLRLHGSSGDVYYRFDWMPRARVFRECSASGIPGMVIFRESPSSDMLTAPCEVGPPQPLRTFGVSCRLEVVPAQARRNEAVEMHYVISSPDSQRVSGRYLRSDEETFGRSIRLRSEAGTEYRFLRTSLFSYPGSVEVDTGEVTPRTYRFRFPAPHGSANARLVSTREWHRVWAAGDSASRAARERVFAAGARTIPPGSYVVSADLSYEIFWTRDRTRSGFSPEADALPCSPARLVVSP